MPVNDQQVTNKQHAVPQNIMDVEFKIIGDLTMRQFFYLLIFGALAYMSFTVFDNALFKWLLGLFFVGLGVVLAFLPIEDRGLDEWITNFFRGIYLPNQRVWRKEPIPPTAFSYQNINVVKQELITLTPTTSRRQLEEYLDSYSAKQEVDPLDINEAEYVRKVHEAYLSMPVSTTTTTAPPIQQAPPIQPAAQPIVQQQDEPEKGEQDADSRREQEGRDGKKEGQQTQEAKPQEKHEEQMETQKETTVESGEQKAPVQSQQDVKPQKPAPKKKDKFKIKLPETRKQSQSTLLPISPDRHTGRKFTSLLPNQGEIVLPIRGEKVLKTKEIVDAEEDLQEKADQLQQLLQQIKSDESIIKATSTQKETDREKEQEQPQQEQKTVEQPAQEQEQDKPKEEQISEKAEQVVKEIEGEKEQLDKEITKIQSEIDTAQQPQEKSMKEKILQGLLQKKSQKNEDYDKLKKQVAELQQQLAQKQESGGQQPGRKVDPTFAQIQPLTDEPNIVSGVVKNAEGVALTGVVAIVKSQSGEPVRAIKSNTLGQFKITTPLTNGVYTIEIDKSNKTGLSFDIIQVVADGKIIPPIEFVGKK